jgi:hypothetical protein
MANRAEWHLNWRKIAITLIDPDWPNLDECKRLP